MGKAAEALYYLVHPSELRSIIQWKVWHDPVHERDESKECETLKRCFYFLDKTSRSFAAVIKELHPELLVPVCLFYLILRGLDTIEDDMTIPLAEKEPLLHDFDKVLDKDGWSYSGNHVKEKDRDLLVEFSCVITEFKKIKPSYQAIIKDITKRMGDGMAEYCNNAEHNTNGVNTIQDYERYCHYVAGLVGEGLTRLFVEAKLANEVLLERPDLHESMGQFLQQVNILRDIREDWEDNRRFWPKEIWSKYVDKFEDLLQPENKTKAMHASSEMVLTALTRAPDCLYYLAGLREQSVFNFCAIPQSMAIATLDACFNNPAIFQTNVKITKGQACRLMLDSTQNLQTLCDVFRRYARSIAKKNDPRDPNFLSISIACGKIEQFIETIFPSQKPGAAPAGKPYKTAEAEERERLRQQESNWDTIYMSLAVLAVLTIITGFMILIAWFAGARFDIMFEQLRKGVLFPPTNLQEAADIAKSHDHGEL
ncbi:farnesyl-diphosphate farnesyltransferase [Verruconis gallopava]|uniref:Squalene synthase n=1 Tax=Verruconis gallopava TaxID=253628 RepID=A0A0D1Z2M1_9PEZI|nr:farnesyl-diphosphate farnesyltransferase [Verruconis gallopava]KIW07207.1 farnesyl-diphosphate farnesyltransferase [Verruconis gallopava]